MAIFNRGITIGSAEQMTNVKHHNLVDQATVSSIDRQDFNTANTSPVHIGSAAPSSPATHLHWFDTSNNTLKRYDGTRFAIVGSGVMLTNKSGGVVAANACVVVDTANNQSFTTTTMASNTLAIGVTAVSSNDGDVVPVIDKGEFDVNIGNAASVPGGPVSTSTSAGVASATGTIDASVFARTIEVDLSGSPKLVRCFLGL